MGIRNRYGTTFDDARQDPNPSTLDAGLPVLTEEATLLGSHITIHGSVTSATGTANQVTVTPTTGSVVVSLPSAGTLPTNWTATGPLTVSGGGLRAVFFDSGGHSSLEFGRVDGSASTPFIDFHSGATNVDYDSRLQASGGTGATGGGTFTIVAASTVIGADPGGTEFFRVGGTGRFGTANNTRVVIPALGARFQVDENTTGHVGNFGSTTFTDAGALRYGTYLSYDAYWDDTAFNWVANRTTLGHKWMLDMGYHNDAFRVRRYDGVVSAPWADSAWNLLFSISSQGSVIIGTAASKVIPGATSLSLRNNADNADNLLLTDAGLATLRNSIDVTTGGYKIAGTSVITQSANYHQFLRKDGSTGLYLGGTGDQASYYDNDSHHFRMASGFGSEKLLLTSTLLSTIAGVDVTIGSLGRFDSSDTATDQQLLVYKAGSTNKWQAEAVQFMWANGDFKTALLADATALTYVFLDPGTGGALPAPNTPAVPVVAQDHLTHTLEIRDYVKTSNFRYFEWQYCTGASCTGWIALANTTSTSIVHTRLVSGTVYRYQVRAVGKDGDLTAFTLTGDNTATANSETHAFGTIIAGMITVANLSAINVDCGILTAGLIQNAGATQGVVISGSVPGGFTQYLNLNGSGFFLKHSQFDLDYSGNCTLSGHLTVTGTNFQTVSAVYNEHYLGTKVNATFAATGIDYVHAQVETAVGVDAGASSYASIVNLLLGREVRGIQDLVNIQDNVTDYFQLRVANLRTSGGGSVTTLYGLKVDDLSFGTTNYALYTGTGLVRFGDKTRGVDGSAAAPMYAFTNATGAGLYWDNGNTALKLAVSGAEQVSWTATDMFAKLVNTYLGGSTTRNRVAHVPWTAANKTTTSTADTSLSSYTLPAGTLDRDGAGVRITATFLSTSTSRFYLKFGATTSGDVTTTVNGAAVHFSATVIRRATSSQRAAIFQADNKNNDGTGFITIGTASPAENQANTIVIDFRCDQVAAGTATLQNASIIYLDPDTKDVA